MTNNPLLAIIEDKTMREAFFAISLNRKIDHRTLVSRLHVTSDAITNACTRIKAYGFIDELRGPIPEFSTYFVTKDGLEAYRKMSRLFSEY